MAVVFGTNFADSIFGTNFNDDLRGFGGNDVFRSFVGNDFVDGGSGFDTADYGSLGRVMSIGPGGIVNKNGLGFDRLVRVERVIGSRGFANWVDGQGGTGRGSLNVNLAANSVTVNGIPGIGSFSISVLNFFNVRGTNNADRITGNSSSNVLEGAGGNDILTGGGRNDALVGGSGSDILTGTNSSFRGNGEIDRLTGGTGADGFVLGDRFGSYYRNGIDRDYAIISDFSFNDLIQLGAGDIYQAVRDASGFNLFVARNGGFDFIADVNATFFAQLPVGNFRLASGQVFGNFIGA